MTVRKYMNDLWASVSSTVLGMAATGRIAFTKPVTELYPHEKYVPPDRYRGVLHNKIEDCTGCAACVRACPVNCIHIQTSKRDAENFAQASDGTPIKLWTTQFDIDVSLCMWCGLCTEPCPTHCLTMTKQYELSVHDKRDLYLEFAVDAERAAAAAARAAAAAAAAAGAATGAAKVEKAQNAPDGTAAAPKPAATSASASAPAATPAPAAKSPGAANGEKQEKKQEKEGQA